MGLSSQGVDYIVQFTGYLPDAQLQLVEIYGEKLRNGESNNPIDGEKKIDIENSSSAFAAIYNSKGQPISSSDVLNGEMPNLPNGVFKYAKDHGMDKFTGQPSKGVRHALAVKYYEGQPGGFVASGKSLIGTEERIENWGQIVLGEWITAIIVTLLVLMGVDTFSNSLLR